MKTENETIVLRYSSEGVQVLIDDLRRIRKAALKERNKPGAHDVATLLSHTIALLMEYKAILHRREMRRANAE
jgi:hypothetical protein